MVVVARLALLILTMAGTLFVTSSLFVDPYFVPKWLILVCGAILFGFLTAVHLLYPFDKFPARGHVVLAYAVSSLLFAESIYALALSAPSALAGFGVPAKGTFDNPAGLSACLCSGFPYYLYIIGKNCGWRRGLLSLGGAVVATAVLLSESRAGALSLLVVFSLWLGKRWCVSAKIKRVAFGAAIVSCVTLLYFLKKDSADGRLLIWKCAAEMISDKPLFGWGVGGFEAHYMDYQAAYFSERPDSRYAFLADTVQYPFNEYLNIGVAFGLAGLLSLAALLICLLRRYRQCPTEEKESDALCWVAVAVFALFSYPLMYPFVWIMLLLGGYSLVKGANAFSIRSVVYKVAAIPCACLCAVAGSLLYQRTEAELEWGKAVNSPRVDETALRRYERIYGVMRSDRYFLYNYAAALSQCHRYDRSLEVALACRNRWADYDLELLIARLYEHNGETNKAEERYRQASLMCPNRFIPLFQLALLLDKEGRIEEAKALAQRIVDKPVKVSSYQIKQIKEKMSDYIAKTE